MPNKFNFQGAVSTLMDIKKRIVVPSSHRARLNPEVDGDGFVANVAADELIWLFPQNYYPEVVADAEAMATTDDELEAVRYHYLGYGVHCPMDAQNRVTLPADMLARSGAGRELVIVGMSDHLEVWPAERWAEKLKKVTAKPLGRLGIGHRLPGTAAGVSSVTRSPAVSPATVVPPTPGQG
ncbi:MAG: hypothetical protein QM770_19895 [Tepidisphaeraceae bacterium]